MKEFENLNRPLYDDCINSGKILPFRSDFKPWHATFVDPGAKKSLPVVNCVSTPTGSWWLRKQRISVAPESIAPAECSLEGSIQPSRRAVGFCRRHGRPDLRWVINWRCARRPERRQPRRPKLGYKSTRLRDLGAVRCFEAPRDAVNDTAAEEAGVLPRRHASWSLPTAPPISPRGPVIPRGEIPFNPVPISQRREVHPWGTRNIAEGDSHSGSVHRRALVDVACRHRRRSGGTLNGTHSPRRPASRPQPSRRVGHGGGREPERRGGSQRALRQHTGRTVRMVDHVEADEANRRRSARPPSTDSRRSRTLPELTTQAEFVASVRDDRRGPGTPGARAVRR